MTAESTMNWMTVCRDWLNNFDQVCWEYAKVHLSNLTTSGRIIPISGFTGKNHFRDQNQQEADG